MRIQHQDACACITTVIDYIQVVRQILEKTGASTRNRFYKICLNIMNFENTEIDRARYNLKRSRKF